MRSFIAFIERCWAAIANTLQVSGYDWKNSLIPSAIITGLTTAIGFFQSVSVFHLAVGVPVAFAATMLALALAKVWPFLGKASAIAGVPPIMAIDLFTDPGFRKKRDEAIHKQYEIQAQLEIIKYQLTSIYRKQSRSSLSLLEPKTVEEMELLDQLGELDDRKSWVDIEYEKARGRVMTDFLGKLFAGQLIALGFALPITHETPGVDIPQLQWDFLRFDGSLENASGQGISYRVVSIRHA